MKISVIIPTFNKSQLLISTLNSFNMSTFNEFEVIICNDGSDNIFSLVDNFNFNYPIKIIDLEHGGRAKARNAGIKIATGELIVFNDDDTLVSKEFLEQHWNAYIKNPNNIILGQRLQLYLDDRQIKEYNYNSKSINFKKYIDLAKEDIYTAKTKKYIFSNNRSKHWITCITSNISISLNLIKEFGDFDENFNGWGFEDIELGYRFSKNSIEFYYDSNIKNYHIEHKRNKLKMIKEMQYNIQYFYNKYNKPNDIYYFWKFYKGEIGIIKFDKLTLNEIKTYKNESYFKLFSRSGLKELE